jgi:hypothetical protein
MDPEPRVGQRKVGVDRDRTLEQRQRRGGAACVVRVRGYAEGLPRLQRGRRGLHERRRVLLDGGQRFTDSRPEPARHLTQRAEDILLPRRLRLFVSENVAGIAVRRPQAEDVVTAEHRDRSIEDCGARGPNAHVVSDVANQPSIRGLLHQPQLSLDPLL